MNNHRSNKILVVEDNKDIRNLLREFLENLDCDVIEAENIEDIVDIALSEVPDLILVDLGFAENRGLGLVYKIRQNPMLCYIPILANSTDGKLGMELFLNIEMLGTGSIDYITKPFSFGELSERIETLFNKKKKPFDFTNLKSPEVFY
ncbi:MAG: response regulator [Aridibacter sp.]